MRILLITGVVLLLAGAWALWRKRRNAGPMLTQPGRVPEMKGSFEAPAGARGVDVALGREIARLLETGRRPEAIALVRERTGWGTGEADEMVTKLERLMKRLG